MEFRANIMKGAKIYGILINHVKKVSKKLYVGAKIYGPLSFSQNYEYIWLPSESCLLRKKREKIDIVPK